MSENLLRASGLSVVATTTNDIKDTNKIASLPGLQNGGIEVNEVKKFVTVPRGVVVYGENYLECVGSAFHFPNGQFMMTHHYGDWLVKKMKVFESGGEVARALPDVAGGVAVIWRKAFSDKSEDRPRMQGAELWHEELVKIYLQRATTIYDMVFREWYWPLSAYYNGAEVLTLVANLEDYQKLLKPEIRRLK